jgi:hypothetical protein
MNKQLYKLIFLIDKNPLVKDFNDIEEILKKIFGYKKFKEVSKEENYKNFNFGHGGRNQAFNLVNEESHVYEIQRFPGTSKDNFITIKITGYNLQTCDCYYLVDDIIVFGKSTINELKNLMKEKEIL